MASRNNQPTDAPLSLPAMLVDIGEELEAGARSPLSLDESRVWFVGAGGVDVFLVEHTDGAGEGIRHHLLRAEPGEVAFAPGAPDGSLDYRFQAVPIAQSTLIKVTEDEPAGIVSDEAAGVAVAAAVDGWIGALVHAMDRRDRPSGWRPLMVGGETAVKTGEVHSPAEAVVWVRSKEGELALEGIPDLAELDLSEYFAIPPGVWIRATADGALETIGTLALLRSEGGLGRLHRLNHRLAGALGGMLRRASERERNRLERQFGSDRDAMSASLQRLASVMDQPGPSPARIDPDEADSALLAACREVGRALGIDVVEPLSTPRRSRTPLIEQIASASQVRYRSVILNPGWWKQDAGPVIAFDGRERPGGGDREGTLAGL